MGILVDTVRVANFRSLRNVEVTLSPVTVLVGMNNSGKTSFLKALQLALGADRRVVSADDFFVDGAASVGRDRSQQILIDVRIVPVGADGTRVDEFDDAWINTQFGGELVNFDADARQYVAVRTRVEFDALRNDYAIQRLCLNGWRSFDRWLDTPEKKRLNRRFDQVVSFLIDAQRDVVGDLRNRTSYIGRLLSKVEIAPADVKEIEDRLGQLNADIVSRSEVLNHIRESLSGLNQTVPSFGPGVEITPVSKTLRDITKGLDVQFSDSQASTFPLDYHGMGTRSWASLLTYQAYVSWLQRQASQAIHTPYHPILALEEPESHLHPNAQRCLYDQLAQSIGQKIISTHSPYVAAQADLAELRHFHKTAAETKVTALALAGLEPEDLRKIRREVMHTRGELLFARAIVLFEGETEEQALPIFARAHWNEAPFIHGVVFLGVGGDSNYLPFLRVAASMAIPWFIFSDGESEAVAAVTKALNAVGATLPDDRVTVLSHGRNVERYLIDENYQDDLKQGILAFLEPTFANAQHRQAKQREVAGWSEEQLLKFLAAWKTKLSPHWAAAIVSRPDARRIPPAIREILGRLDTVLTPVPEVQHEG